MKPWRVLVFPGGTEIGLEINKSLRDCKEVELFSAGDDVSNHAPFVFRHHHFVPSIREAGWLERLNQVITEERIDFVFPAHDDVIVALAEAGHDLRAAVVSSPLDSCRLTRSKSATYACLAGVLPVPVVHLPPLPDHCYPVFVKPDRGQGSQGAQAVRNAQELAVAMAAVDDPLVLELLPGDEYTVDCFTDREQGVMYSRGRQRVRTRAGISMDSRSVHDPAFEAYAAAIARHIPLCGAWFYQVKRRATGQLVVMEVGPRIAGTMALARVEGVNLPLLSLYEQARQPVTIRPNAFTVTIDRALVNRYSHSLAFSTVYVDLDDTLLLRGRVNLELVRLIYQWLNEGKRLVLLTRHARDVHSTLRQHRLSALFDEVCHLQAGEPKSAYVTDQDAILIDDSFRERMQVQGATGIPTFDCSMLELLLDDRA